MASVQFASTNLTGTTIVASDRPASVAFGAFGRLRYDDDQRVLFVLRESSTGAVHELASLASMVLGRHDYRSGVGALVSAGVAPLREPAAYSGKPVPVAQGSASLIQTGNSWIFYALTSAAKDTESGDNPFTEALVGEIRRIRPHVIVTGSISRLVRHEHHISSLARALSSVKPILECNERHIDFRRNPSAGAEFTEIATHAIRDRSITVARLETGRFATANRGLYPFQEFTLPIGYRRARDKSIVLMGAPQQAALRRAFELLADPTKSMGAVASVLVASNAFMTRKAGSDTSPLHPLTKRNASLWVRRLVDRIGTWERGVHVMHQKSSSIAHDVVMLEDVDGPIIATYEFELPLPPGGWATPEVFAAVRERGRKAEAKRNRIRQTSPEKQSHQMPLTGFRWRRADTEYGLSTRRGSENNKTVSRYVLAVRAAAANAVAAQPGGRAWSKSLERGWGSPTSTSPQFRCYIDASQLHRSVASALGSLSSFEFEESAEILSDFASRSTSPSDTVREERKAVEQELNRAQVVRRRAREAMYSTDRDDPMYDVFKADYAAAVASEKRIASSLAEVRTRPAPSVPKEPWSARPGDFLVALAHLHEVTGALPQAVIKALHSLLSDFTVTYDAKRGEVEWSLRLRLLTHDGTGERLTRPITGRVPIVSARRGQESLAQLEEQSLRRYMDDEEVGPDRHAPAATALRLRGITGRGAAQALLSAPLDVRAVVIAGLLDEPHERKFDPDFLDLLVRSYVRYPGTRGPWNAAGERRQAVLDILANEGPTLRHELWQRLGGEETERVFDQHIRESGGTWLGVTVIERYYTAASKDSGQKVRVNCRTCPHCGGMIDIVARVAECPAGLLCSACLRMPVPGSPEFPECYRNLAARPQARRYVESSQPPWWADLSRAHAAYPSNPLTTLASSLGRPRHEVKAACEALGLSVKALGTISHEWSDARLRVEYVDRNRRLEDLAFELGVSTGTLTKRLRAAGISKYTKRDGTTRVSMA